MDGRIRYLRNVMGLWLLQESLRTWELEGTPESLAGAAHRGGATCRRAARRSTRTIRPSCHRATCRRASPRPAARPTSPRPRRRPALVRCDPRQPRRGLSAGRSATRRGCPAGRRGRPPRRWRRPERAAVPADRGRLRAAGRGRAGRGDRARQRPRPGARRGLLSGDLETLRALVRRTQDIRRYEPRDRRMRPARSLSGARSRCSSPATTTCCSPRSARRWSRCSAGSATRSSSRPSQTCCGQMHFNSGYQDACVPLVERFVGRVRRLRRRRHAVGLVRLDGPPPPRARRRPAAGADATLPDRVADGRAARLELSEFLVDDAGRDRRRRALPAHASPSTRPATPPGCWGSATGRPVCSPRSRA